MFQWVEKQQKELLKCIIHTLTDSIRMLKEARLVLDHSLPRSHM